MTTERDYLYSRGVNTDDNPAPTHVILETSTGVLIYQDKYGRPLHLDTAEMLADTFNAASKDHHTYKVFRLVEMVTA